MAVKGPVTLIRWRWRWRMRLALVLLLVTMQFEASMPRSIGLRSTEAESDEGPAENSNSSYYDTTGVLNVTTATQNPCVLIGDSLDWATVVSLPVDGERGPLIVVTHPLFDIDGGIVPAITYKVSVTIPPEHEFTLEYFVLGLREDVKSHSKHRHQRERKHDELIQLDVSASASASTSADASTNETASSSSPSLGSEVVICTKNSIGSFKSPSSDLASTTYAFDWYLMDVSSWFSPSSQVLFRLRLRSSSDTTTSVLEQILKVNIKSECNLKVHLNQESHHISMSSLWNPHTDNFGLICTLSLIPRPSQGLEILISNLSIHGVRELCTERFLSFSTNRNLNNTRARTLRPQQYDEDENAHESESGGESGGGVKFCGKLEDYSLAERTLTFTPQIKHKHKQDDTDLSTDSEGDDTLAAGAAGMFVLVRIRLPGYVKARETFSLQANSLSPCQKVVLTDLSGTLKYYVGHEVGHGGHIGFEECSIVIHVPYGYTILTEFSVLNVNVNENETGAGISDRFPFIEISPLDSINLENSIIVDSRQEKAVGEAGASAEDCLRTEAPIDNLLIVHALDVGVDRINYFCFEAPSAPASDQDNTRSRLLHSQSNQLKLTFTLKYFNQFVISYKSVHVSDVTGDCDGDEGWINVDKGCVLLVEKATTWVQAEKDCQKQKAHLLTVRSEGASSEIEKMLVASPRFNPGVGYWIGANDRESEGNFQWSSGLPFLYSNWFGGWWHNGKEVLTAQPNDDGLSRQDCVELRDALSSITFSRFQAATAAVAGNHQRPLSPSKSNLTWVSSEQSNKLPSSNQQQQRRLRFHWNDRNCDAKNFYICEKEIERDEDILCNQTIHFGAQQLSPVTITSPAYPSAYPDNMACFISVETLPNYKIIVTFDEFVLEESTGCNYDALELLEQQPDGNANVKSTRLCGDWTPKLKLLRYVSNSSSLVFKFESDFSHHFAGFRATVSTEKDTKHECSDQQMLTFENHCYLFVSAPAATWKAALHACTASKAQLASILSFEEWNFVTKTLASNSNFDKRSATWLGGSIDQSNQLVWTDRMPFNFSAFHQSDLQSLADWKCLSMYWHRGGPKETFAWKLADCKQKSGYICKKSKQGDGKRSPLGRTFSGTGGKLASLNFPANYYDNLDYLNHLVAPKGTRIIVRFTHLDVEGQADCLYDYVEFIDRKTGNSTRVCGSYAGTNLNRFDFLTSSSEVDIVFHSDYADSFSGFELIWTAIDVTSCLSEKQIILTGQENQPYELGTNQQSIHTPNFPYFNLRDVNCVFSVVAPAGYRILLRFDVFEIGRGTAETGDKCGSATATGDHVIVELGSQTTNTTAAFLQEDLEASSSSVWLCGNLTSFPQQTTFVSFQEKMRIRLFSFEGRTGRGFVGKVKAVPMNFEEQVSVPVAPNASFLLTSFNYPLSPPVAGNLTMSFTLPPNYIVSLRMFGVSYPNCDSFPGTTTTSFLIFRDPYDGVNGSSTAICQLRDAPALLAAEGYDEDAEEGDSDSSDNDKTDEIQGRLPTFGPRNSRKLVESDFPVPALITLQTTFNRFKITQVYKSAGEKWSVEVVSSLDEQFRAKVLAGGDRLLLLNGCTPNPCAHNGQCVTEQDGKHICRCSPPFTGPFCGLTLCDLNPCLFGQCVLEGTSFKCVCQMGYGGERCDRRHRPCDDKPCSHGECVEQHESNSTYKCLCFAFWQGPRCDERMQNIPYKPLSERMLKEPFWLGILTVFLVLGVIGLVFCLRRHFPEKLEKLLNEDLDKTRGISWVSGRSPSSLGFGGCGNYGMRESIAGTSVQSNSPQTTRSLLGRFGIRKPSLLSLSSANSAISVQANSPHKYETRTFSLDDLLRPSRSMMMRTPSPHRRRNFSIHGRRDPVEKQQILQQLVSSSVHSSDGEGRKPRKPTIGEIIQMSERRLRLASTSSMQHEPPSPSPTPSIAMEAETSFTTPTTLTLAQQKAEKKVTFARLLDKLTAKEMSSSSSCSDISCPEDKIIIPVKISSKKDRKGRFRRSKSYNRARTSETESIEGVEMSSSDTTPDPIYAPKFPSRICVSPTGLSVSATNSPTPKQSKSLSKIPSADSLLALFRRFSGSSSAPPSPQYSENEESSAGATPLSTPGSPRTSQLSLNIRPPAFHITTSEPTTVEVPVIDAQTNANWRSAQQACITLEVPLRDYCLSPIHEVPTPLPTPSHSPANSPMMQRQQPTDTIPVIQIQASSEAEGDDEHDYTEEREARRKQQNTGFSSLPFSISNKSFEIPMISISAEDDPNQQTIMETDIDELVKADKISRRRRRMSESEMLPDVLIHVPPDVPSESAYSDESMSPDPDTPRRTKNKPPPLVFANEILSYVKKDGEDDAEGPSYEIPVLNVESATPIADQTSSIHPKEGLPDLMPHLKQLQLQQSSWEPHPLTPPIIMINQNSEPESDSDTVVRRLMLRPSLTFLSPFAGATDRVPSESNLSTSGYSSMASPCPSRCPSVSPLCPLELEDHLNHCQGCCKCHHIHFRRSSLTPSSSRKSSLTTSRRCSLNGTPIFTSHLYENSAMNFNENSEHNLKDWNVDSAVETDQEHEVCGSFQQGADGQSQSSKTMSPISEEMKSIYSFLEVPRKTVPKSQSLDMNSSTGKQKTRLKGESLDSKLNSIDPAAFQTMFTFDTFDTVKKAVPALSKEKETLTCSILQEDQQQKLSPTGSRSDSPLSDLGGGGTSNTLPAGGLLTAGTDTDGVYDGLSSEVPGNSSNFHLQTISPQQQIKRSGRRRNRRMSTGSQNKNLLGVHHKSHSGVTGAGEVQSPERVSLLPTDFRHRDLNVGTGAGTSSAGSSKRASPKRRTRAQPNPGSSSSSSIESLNSLRSNASSPGFRHEKHSGSEKLLPKSETSTQIQSSDKPPRARPKISRLKTISLQIRFLRRLEQNLIRKKESLAIFTRESSERRPSKTSGRQDSSSSCTSGSTCGSSCSCTGSCCEDRTDELHHEYDYDDGRSEDSDEEGVEMEADQPLLGSASASASSSKSSSRRNAQGGLARTNERRGRPHK